MIKIIHITKRLVILLRTHNFYNIFATNFNELDEIYLLNTEALPKTFAMYYLIEINLGFRMYGKPNLYKCHVYGL